MIKRNILVIAATIIVYGIIIGYFGPDDIFQAFAKVSLADFIIAVFFVLLSLAIEFLRWHYYLNQLKIDVPVGKSANIFLSGLSLGFMPSKSGELLRFFILKKEGLSLFRTIPIHFVSNLTSLFVSLVVASPIFLFYGNKDIFFVYISLIILFLLSLRYSDRVVLLLSLIGKKIGKGFISRIRKAVQSSKVLLKTKALVISLSLTFIYYFCIFISFYFISRNFDMRVPVYLAYAVYTLSLIAGVISMIPGGIGIVEGGSIAVLSSYMDEPSAAALILLVRIITLWMTVFIGIAAVNSYAVLRNHGKSKRRTVS
jgi:glycosyltransferase 2 family protein